MLTYSFFGKNIYIPDDKLMIIHPTTNEEYKTSDFLKDFTYTCIKLNISPKNISSQYVLYKLKIKESCILKTLGDDMIDRLTQNIVKKLQIKDDQIFANDPSIYEKIKSVFEEENALYRKNIEDTYDLIIRKLEKCQPHEKPKYAFTKAHYSAGKKDSIIHPITKQNVSTFTLVKKITDICKKFNFADKDLTIGYINCMLDITDHHNQILDHEMENYLKVIHELNENLIASGESTRLSSDVVEEQRNYILNHKSTVKNNFKYLNVFSFLNDL